MAKHLTVRKRHRRTFMLSAACYGGASLMLMLLPLGDISGDGFQKALSYILAGCFWLSAMSGTLFLILTLLNTKNVEKELNVSRSENTKDNLPGIISFFKNPLAVICDICFFLSIGWFLAIIVFNISSQWVFSVCIGFFLLSLTSHSFFNGKNFRYILM